MRNIVLTGLSGCGKSTLGRRLSEMLGCMFIDTDGWIEKRQGMSITQIFSDCGEEFFRDTETFALTEALKSEGAVIATGGGMVLRRENVDAMRSSGAVVFIDRPVDNILSDIEVENRPLLKGGAEKLRKLSTDRDVLYRESAHFVLRNTSTEDDALARLAVFAKAVLADADYYVIGDPIGHTQSPAIHGAAFEKRHMNTVYKAMHVPRGTLDCFTAGIKLSRVKGFNVTIPHKQDILTFVDEVSLQAVLTGAVNTVVKTHRQLKGYTTDADGFLQTLRDEGVEPTDCKIVIYGAGGAARSLASRFVSDGVCGLTVVARRMPEPEFPQGCTVKTGGLEVLAEEAKGANLLINATPLGMKGIASDFESFDFLGGLASGALVYDLIYDPPETELLRKARELGLKTVNGRMMLIYQAIYAQELFTEEKLNKEELAEYVRSRM